MEHSRFVAAINCMDGRTQLPVNEWMRREYEVDYVDTITEPGPVKILAEAPASLQARSVQVRLTISVERHGSRAVAVVAHHDCAGNPRPELEQLVQLRSALDAVRGWGLGIEVVGLWVDEAWQVRRVE